ncbi:MAG: hypothetical protein Q8Q59_11930 [Luteolibacter sp.]|jgi:hypothetical protein|nr:hypothetical protein [Luteolibacter sp.]
MSRITSTAFSTGLIGTGMLAWALAGRPLVHNPDLNAPMNPLGINGSPYGEVFAMAMQGPIDTHFHGAWSGGGPAHQHAEGEHCDSCQPVKAEPTSGNRFQNLLTSLEKAVETRTNRKSASAAHKRYLRRQVEDKLRFAYQLDPSHYANYNSLHFFLTEPQLGTRPELTPSAAKLAEETIQYCLKQDNDPRPALTAAAATSNILELMFNDRQNAAPKFTTEQMRQYLTLLDHCISRYVAIARQWDTTKNWQLLSPQRSTECDERLHFILKFREAAEGTILRFEGKTLPTQVAN